MANTLFFVYGTLKEGGHFAGSFDKDRISCRKAAALGFDLYNLGWFPGIVRGEGKVYGEVHEFDDKDGRILRAFDGIEGYSEKDDDGLYRRRKIKVTTDQGEEVDAFVYIFNQAISEKSEHIESGEWDLEKYAR